MDSDESGSHDDAVEMVLMVVALTLMIGVVIVVAVVTFMAVTVVEMIVFNSDSNSGGETVVVEFQIVLMI